MHPASQIDACFRVGRAHRDERGKIVSMPPNFPKQFHEGEHPARRKKRVLKERDVLLTSMIMDMMLDPTPEERALYERLRALVKSFEQRVWLGGGLQGMNREQTVRGLRKKPQRAEDVSMLLYTIAGRTMITLERGDVMFTLVAGPDGQDPVAGLHGLRGTEAEVAGLVLDAMAEWQVFPFIEPDPVHILGIPA